MSAFGGGDSLTAQQLRQIIAEATAQLEDFESSVRGASRAAQDSGRAMSALNRSVNLGFVGNAAYRAARSFGRGVGLQALGESIQAGSSLGDTITRAAIENVPFSPFAQTTDALKEAQNRVAAIAGQVGRATGVALDPNQLAAIEARFRPQAMGASAANRAVRDYFNDPDVIARYIAKGSNLDRTLDAAQGARDATRGAVNKLLEAIGVDTK